MIEISSGDVSPVPPRRADPGEVASLRRGRIVDRPQTTMMTQRCLRSDEESEVPVIGRSGVTTARSDGATVVQSAAIGFIRLRIMILTFQAA
jgi:hypothetical protein